MGAVESEVLHLPTKRKRVRRRKGGLTSRGLVVSETLLKVKPAATEGECAAIVKRCTNARADYLHRLSLRAEQLGPRRRKRLTRYYLAVEAFRIATLCAALIHRGEEVGAEGSSWTWKRIIEEGRLLSAFDADDDVLAFGVEKKDGEGRLTYCFTPTDLARQRLLHDVGKLLTPLHSRQFLYWGGEQRLMDWLRTELPNARWALVTDVPACHHVVDRDCVVKGLPLPERAVRGQLVDPLFKAKLAGPSRGAGGGFSFSLPLSPHPTLKVGDYVGEPFPGRGIAPGSALASLAAEVVIRDLIVGVEVSAPGVVAGSFADNIIVFGANEEAIESVKQALGTVGASLFGGAAAEGLLRRTEVYPTNKMGAFLGRIPELVRDTVILRASQAHMDRIEVLANLDGLEAARTGSVSADRALHRLLGFGTRHAGDDRAVRHVVRLAWELGREIGPNSELDGDHIR